MRPLRHTSVVILVYCLLTLDALAKGDGFGHTDISPHCQCLQAPLTELRHWNQIEIYCKTPGLWGDYLYIGLFDEAILRMEDAQFRNGKFVAPADRPLPDADVFELPDREGRDTLEFSLSILHHYPLPLQAPPQLLLFSEREYEAWRQSQVRKEKNIFYQLGMAQGAMLAFMIFPLALFWLNRQPYYLYYMAYVILVAANDQIEFERFSHLDLWVSHKPALFSAFLNLLQIAAIGFYIAFFREFLELKHRMPWLDNMLRYLIGYCILVFAADFAISVLGPAGRQNHFLFWLARVPTAVGAIISVGAIMRWKDLDARFVCIGVLSWMTGVSIAFSANGGAFPLHLLNGFFSNPYIFIHLGVLLELFFFSLAMSYRNQQHILKRHQAEWALSDVQKNHQLELDRISRDLHDEIGSTLSSISILGDSTLQNLPSNMSQARLATISERARQVMDTMSDIIWSVNSRNDTMANVLQRMKEFAIEILESQGITLHFEADETVQSLNMSMEMRRDFYLVFKEAVNNAAKYSRASEVRVRVSAGNGILSLEVRDNGRGFNPSQVNSGNGLLNMHRRAERMGGKLEIESEAGAGTSVLFKG